MPSVRCRCVDSCGVEETVWSFFRQLSFAGAIFALGVAGVCSGQEGQPAKAPQERPLVTVSPEALAVHHRGFVFDGHNDLPWVVRTDASRSFDKLDIAQPQPKSTPIFLGLSKAASERSSGRSMFRQIR